jgi:two-component system, OmpR family, sensor histidine kinase RstB
VKRLYLQIYLTIVVILVIATVAVGLMSRFAFDAERFDDMMTVARELAVKALPPPEAPPARQQEAVERLHDMLRIDLALYAPDGVLLAAAGRRLPPPDSDAALPIRLRGPHGAWILPLSDGRILVTGLWRGPWRPGPWVLVALLAVAFAVAIGAWPLVRRLTRRLERLKTGVEQLGEGDLGARVKIEGKDEIAALARSFNHSAGRIEELVNSHKMLLANASHELRTPLTRINMALAMSDTAANPRQREQIKADIAELDQLIEEILLASRLDAVRSTERFEEIDLLALVAEEAARDGIGVEGTSVLVHGERALLRRMVRNLIDNARYHGGDIAPQVTVNRLPGHGAQIEVRDHGPGIPEGERGRIFEPFYRLAGSAETGRGSGLGLALVRQIARHHGGEVQCRAAAGGGSVFSIVIPATESAPKVVS